MSAARFLSPRARDALLILAIALALRIWDFGNPAIHVDEQYYLLVGDRLLHGAVPYVDIWDRKPIGLFLLFAAIRVLPGDGILAYQIVATLFAAATAVIVAAIARRTGANREGALAAAAAYLLLLSLLGGRGGQAPVFYDLPMAAAAMLTLRLPDLAARHRTGAIVANGAAACLLAGIAIQIKYTAAVEGIFFGCAHLWFLRKTRARLGPITASGLLWLVLGLLPTLVAGGWYAALGPRAFKVFWFANFMSIGLRPGYPAGELVMRLLGIGAQLLPLVICAALGWHLRPRRDVEAGRTNLAYGWLCAAFGGFLAIGTFFNHYALPVTAPLAVVAAGELGRSRRALTATFGLGLLLFGIERIVHHHESGNVRETAALVARNSTGGCPYVFVGDTILYHLAHACLPTIYAFPNFLAYTTEEGAIGIDEAGEVARIMDQRPPVVVTSDRKLNIWNTDSLRIVKARVARDYRLVYAAPRARYHTLVYLRRDLLFRR